MGGEGEMQQKQVEAIERVMHRMAMLRDQEQYGDKIERERRKLAAELREIMEEEAVEEFRVSGNEW